MTIISKDVDMAAQLLSEGKLVAFATETVYGLGADATNDHAVARIFAAKDRPEFNPLIIHVASIEAAREIGEFNHIAAALADRFWPGPLSLVVPRTTDCAVSWLASAGLDSIALRLPGHALARELLSKAGIPVAAPSANPSGRISPTLPEHVVAGLGDKVDMVLDGGACEIGVESTIISCLTPEPVLLRLGGVTKEDIETFLGRSVTASQRDETVPISPGQLASHYAPRASLRINAHDVGNGEALLAFGAHIPQYSGPIRNLSDAEDLTEAAANLFAFLHELDAAGAQTIAVMPIPNHGLGAAINDRLKRAAVPR